MSLYPTPEESGFYGHMDKFSRRDALILLDKSPGDLPNEND